MKSTRHGYQLLGHACMCMACAWHVLHEGGVTITLCPHLLLTPYLLTVCSPSAHRLSPLPRQCERARWQRTPCSTQPPRAPQQPRCMPVGPLHGSCTCLLEYVCICVHVVHIGAFRSTQAHISACKSMRHSACCFIAPRERCRCFISCIDDKRHTGSVEHTDDVA